MSVLLTVWLLRFLFILQIYIYPAKQNVNINNVLLGYTIQVTAPWYAVYSIYHSLEGPCRPS